MLGPHPATEVGRYAHCSWIGLVSTRTLMGWIGERELAASPDPRQHRRNDAGLPHRGLDHAVLRRLLSGEDGPRRWSDAPGRRLGAGFRTRGRLGEGAGRAPGVARAGSG